MKANAGLNGAVVALSCVNHLTKLRRFSDSAGRWRGAPSAENAVALSSIDDSRMLGVAKY